MLQWNKVGVAHWFVFVAFGALFFTLITAYGQLFDPRFALPVIGHWVVYEWASELIAWAGLISIVFLIIVRALQRRPRSAVAILRLAHLAGRLRRADHPRHRGLRALAPGDGVPAAGRGDLAAALPADLVPAAGRASTTASLATGVVVVAAIKIIISMAWFVVIGLNTTMGVAWHRFTVWPNIWFKRESSGRPALGALPPIIVDGKPLDFAEIEDLDEDAALGRRQGRGLHLEGPARLHLVHRVRPLPVAVPGLAHRKAAVAQAADHGPARARVRQGALSAGRRGGAGGAARGDPHRGGPTAGGADPGQRRGRRGDRSRRAVVVHQLRRLRAAVPGRHRARRPHPRPAPLPGDDGVGVPAASSTGCSRAWRTREIRGP